MPMISVRETDELHARLKAIAVREGITVADVARDILRDGIVARERTSLRNYGRE